MVSEVRFHHLSLSSYEPRATTRGIRMSILSTSTLYSPTLPLLTINLCHGLCLTKLELADLEGASRANFSLHKYRHTCCLLSIRHRGFHRAVICDVRTFSLDLTGLPYGYSLAQPETSTLPLTTYILPIHNVQGNTLPVLFDPRKRCL